MIKQISKKILKYLISASVIEDTEESRVYYLYGIEISISSFLNIVLIFTIGIMFKSIIESIIFMICFIPLRQFTGGFHAETYFLCNLSFALCYIILLVVYKLTSEYVTTYMGIVIFLFSCITYLLECPIENKNKMIPNEKKKIHKIIAVILGCVYGITGILLISNKIGIILLYTLVLVSLLVIIAAFQNMESR